MKLELKLLLIIFACYASSSHAWWLVSANTANVTTGTSSANDKAHNEWLKKRFSKQHQQLIPVVAVADIFFSCNKARQTDNTDYTLDFLINQMDKNTLAEKLTSCLGVDTMQSDVALNFGLFGCFHEQLSHLPKIEREQKMTLVKQAVSLLSHEERKKSFSQCVTEQSIHYLK
jgi:ABC-type thiamine transport system substrate-binding protein